MSVSALDAANIVIQVQPFNSPGSLTGDRRVFVVPVGAGTLGFQEKIKHRKPNKKQPVLKCSESDFKKTMN